ncbi:unnamed protein product [Vicia faba]|uniref:Uncharacterized protein n=1 Tax=Vicia faba TaxID=3906 RepID=A0AAV1APJ7_VICFA|nr:unnamed protein product [Vicia faba]
MLSVIKYTQLRIFSLFGHSILQDIEDAPEYAQLSVTLNENLLTTNREFSAEREDSVHGILHKLYFHKFDIFKPMHVMWKDYIALLLKSTWRNQLAQCLLGADLHGAIIFVVDAELTHFTVIGGITIHETSEAFGIVTKDNKFRVVPKKGSVFVFGLGFYRYATSSFDSFQFTHILFTFSLIRYFVVYTKF